CRPSHGRTRTVDGSQQTPPATTLSPETADRIRAALRDSPNQMTLQLARDLGVPEAEVIRCFPDGRAVELDVSRWEEILREAAHPRSGVLSRTPGQRFAPPPSAPVPDRPAPLRLRRAAGRRVLAGEDHFAAAAVPGPLPRPGRGRLHAAGE